VCDRVMSATSCRWGISSLRCAIPRTRSWARHNLGRPSRGQRRHAYTAAVRMLDRARALVTALPSDARLHRELEILTALPTALVGVEGFVSDRPAQAQLRAVEVAGVLGVEPEPPLLRSVVISSLCRADFEGARALGGQLRASARRVAPARASSSVTKRHPVHASTANSTPAWPVNRSASHSRNTIRVAGRICPRTTGRCRCRHSRT
jgi:hypothetical protein